MAALARTCPAGCTVSRNRSSSGRLESLHALVVGGSPISSPLYSFPPIIMVPNESFFYSYCAWRRRLIRLVTVHGHTGNRLAVIPEESRYLSLHILCFTTLVFRVRCCRCCVGLGWHLGLKGPAAAAVLCRVPCNCDTSVASFSLSHLFHPVAFLFFSFVPPSIRPALLFPVSLFFSVLLSPFNFERTETSKMAR